MVSFFSLSLLDVCTPPLTPTQRDKLQCGLLSTNPKLGKKEDYSLEAGCETLRGSPLGTPLRIGATFCRAPPALLVTHSYFPFPFLLFLTLTFNRFNIPTIDDLL